MATSDKPGFVADEAASNAALDIAAALEQLLAKGFEAPLHVAAVALNGTMLFGVYRERASSLDFEVLAEHLVNDVMVLPVNLMVVDRRGEAAHVLFAVDGGPPQIVQ